MRSSTFRRFIVALVTITMLSSQFFWPEQQTAVAATLLVGGISPQHSGACDPNDYAVRNGTDPVCRLATDHSGRKIAYPTVEWKEIAQFAGSPSTGGYDVSYLGGVSTTRLELAGLRSAQMLGLTADKAADIVNTFPAGVPVVFARYNPGTADLRIDLFKTEKVGNGFKLMNAVFSPYHGDQWAVSGTYASPANRAAGNFGPNPFEHFEGGDDVFHHISQNGVNVVVGHAMRMTQAAVGMVAIADYRIHQYKTTKKSFLKKKVTQHIDGYAKPKWMIATPPQFQPRGTSGAICAEDVGSSPCPEYAVAPAMVNLEAWTGGNLHETEDLVYQWQHSTSGWTVFAFILLTFVLMFAVSAIAVAAGYGASSVSLAAQMVEGAVNMAAGTATFALTPLGVAAVNASLYGLTAAVAGGGLTDIQKGYGGAILSGDLTPGAPTNEHQAGMINNTNQRMTQSALDQSLTAVKQTSYGDCALRFGASACGAAAQGVLPRADAPAGQDYVQFYRDNGSPVRYDAGMGALN